MKFTCTVTIDRPINEVVELMDNPDNLAHWQDGFVSYEHLSGTPGKPGAKAKLFYKMGAREMELIETLSEKNWPDIMSATYEHKHMTNTMTNRLTDLGGGKTKWEAELEYIKFNAFLPKMMAWLAPGMFKKQTQKWLDQFKAFAEKE